MTTTDKSSKRVGRKPASGGEPLKRRFPAKSVYISDEVWRRLKARAALEGVALNELLGRMFEQYLKSNFEKKEVG